MGTKITLNDGSIIVTTETTSGGLKKNIVASQSGYIVINEYVIAIKDIVKLEDFE